MSLTVIYRARCPSKTSALSKYSCAQSCRDKVTEKVSNRTITFGAVFIHLVLNRVPMALAIC